MIFIWIYNSKSNEEAYSMFLKYKTKIEKQLDKENKRLRYYRGGEYNDKSLHEYCELNGITHEVTTPYSCQQNDIVEHKSKTL